ncbi:PREDICTED: casein kinase II subunit beta-3-like [Camelina sativa]|uniref:Casein kinase II subunit beta-3-like n=1 Tax=Camelina sativa TaxID=90675 RepID=A0ABM0UUM5_CAMSA|nr:PREDICTED: casein kinase II subunit beta-3-like [Camelina sativa]
MYKERSGGGGGSSRSEILGGAIDRKRINDALNKKLEKSSASNTTSRVLTSKDKDPFSFTSTSTAKSQLPDVESESDSEGSDVSGSEGDDTSWISWFCNLRGYSHLQDIVICSVDVIFSGETCPHSWIEKEAKKK